jgi:hypothetical protein
MVHGWLLSAALTACVLLGDEAAGLSLDVVAYAALI